MADETEETTGPKGVVKSAAEKTKASVEVAREKVRKASVTMREKAGQAGTVAKEHYGTASESIKAGASRARKDLDKLTEDVTTYVRDNPGRAVLIAGALGFFVGFLIRSDRRR